MNLLPLYLRREPTTDDVLLRMAPKARKLDVQTYRDAACTNPIARWPWHYSQGKPRRNCRTVTVNCYRWQAVWLPDLAPRN